MRSYLSNNPVGHVLILPDGHQISRRLDLDLKDPGQCFHPVSLWSFLRCSLLSFSSSMFILKFDTSMPAPSTGRSRAQSCPRHKEASSRGLWKFSLPLVMSRSQDSESVSLPRTVSPERSSKKGSIPTSSPSKVDFDISYFYINRTPPRDAPLTPQRIQQFTLNAHNDTAILPLSFTQSRMDVRRRNELVETALAGKRSAFAVPTQRLIPLSDALNREDIRRRGEGFELAEEARRSARRRGGHFAGVRAENTGPASDDHPPDPARLSALEATGSAPAPRVSSFLSDPSIYSAASWDSSAVQLLPAQDRERSWISVDFGFERDTACGGEAESESSRNMGDLSSSFDEENFLHMAAALGW